MRAVGSRARLGGLAARLAGGAIGILILAGWPALASAGGGISLAFFSGGHGAHASWEQTVTPGGGLAGIELSNPLPTGATYSGATVNGVKGLAMSQVRELSFMIDTNGYMSGGAPRFSVILSDGVVLFPSAGDCFNLPISPHTGWQTAEFVSGTNPCAIYGSTAGPTGGAASWQAWTTFLGDQTIVALYIVQDEGPATAYIARVSVNDTVAR